jgi:hypothetical protein
MSNSLAKSSVLFCLQVCPIDCEAAVELAQLIADIAPQKSKFEWLLSHRLDTPLLQVALMAQHLRRKFAKVTVARAPVYASGWPAGANALWFSTMRYAAAMRESDDTKAEGILTMEPDCVPARRDWMEVLEGAYLNRRAPIVGNLHRSEIPDHINGNSIWPIRLLRDFPELANCPPTEAWDFHHRDKFLPMAEDTPFLTQYYQRLHLTPGEWTNMRKAGYRPALLHGVKDQSARYLARMTLVSQKSLEPKPARVLNVIP